MFSLRTIIGVTIGVMIFIVTVFRGALINQSAQEMSKELAGRALAGLADEAADRVAADLDRLAAQAALLAGLADMRDPAKAQYLLDQLTAREPAVKQAAIIPHGAAPLTDAALMAVAAPLRRIDGEGSPPSLRIAYAPAKALENAKAAAAAQGVELTLLDPAAWKPADPSRNAGWEATAEPDGRAFAVGFAKIGDGGPLATARQPAEIAFAVAAATHYQFVFSGLGLAALFGGLGWLAAERISRPLALMAQAADRMRRGEPGASLPEVWGAAEIHTLSLAAQQLVASLTNSRDALARMETIAYQDRLTTLPNRRFFEQYLDVALARAKAEGGHAVMMYMDLDGFKPVNDRLGHDAGDEVLRQVGIRLASSQRKDDVVARIGGDEFAAVLISSENSGVIDPLEAANRFVEVVAPPIYFNGEAIRVGCSVGVAIWPQDGDDVAMVLKNADTALYEAKRRGKRQAVRYVPDAAGA